MSTLQTANLKNASSGSNNIVLATDGSTTITTLNSTTITGTSVRGVITSGTAVASTSGTSIDFTSIPSWVKRVTVILNRVSTNGTSLIQVQLGTSAGVTTTGYLSAAWAGGSSNVGSTSTTGFVATYSTSASDNLVGHILVTNVSGNIYVASGVTGLNPTTSNVNNALSGSVTLSGTLDRIRITTVNGTDTFDAGSINILYEG